METWVPYALTAGFSLVVGYLIGYLNHGLTKNRESDSRRRRFRDEIRAICLRYDAANWMNFIKTYEETVPIVREACLRIFEDISFWKRHSFIKHRDVYCGFKLSDLQLPTNRCTPADLPIRMKENQKKREEMTVVLKDTLEMIARDAS